MTTADILAATAIVVPLAVAAGMLLRHWIMPIIRRDTAARRERQVIQWVVPAEQNKAVNRG